VQSKPAYKVYRTVNFGEPPSYSSSRLTLTDKCRSDCLKLYTKAHGSKTTNLIINLDHDDWILDDDNVTLASVGMGTYEIAQFTQKAIYLTLKNPAT